ncbi:MAG: ATP-binding protein, partial [Ruminococcus sp.]|nr:ATP-binding protein [Ruminococcus sp.]
NSCLPQKEGYIMAKINVDIENIKKSLECIGYIINDCIERENNGKNWQIKFSNSGAIVTIYDSNNTKNSVVNGKPEEGEKEKLKEIVDGLKSGELIINPLNEAIVQLIRSKKEDDYYDFKQIPHKNNESLLHDILCLSNNTENKDAYLILGVSDNYIVEGVGDDWQSNNIYDFLKSLQFAGEHVPDVTINDLYYTFKRIVVIECKSSKNVPFYLSKKYQGIRANQIYTRVGDTNTPKDQHANYNDVEKLWRIHFNL